MKFYVINTHNRETVLQCIFRYNSLILKISLKYFNKINDQ